MLDFQTLELLFEGLDQKTDHKALKAGKLTRAENVEFDKGGVLNKRRGFRRIQFSGGSQAAAFGRTMETQALRLTTLNDELLIMGPGWLWSVGSKTSSIDAKAIARRGRLGFGNTRSDIIAAASQGGGGGTNEPDPG